MHRVLVVDNDVELGLYLAEELDSAGGFTVRTATTIRDADRLLRHSAPDFSAILMDVVLPDGDGREFCAQLREEGRVLPIILLSALHAEADAVRGLTLGADDYVRKPFSTAELIARLRRLLRDP